jgi:hypothetical protein
MADWDVTAVDDGALSLYAQLKKQGRIHSKSDPMTRERINPAILIGSKSRNARFTWKGHSYWKLSLKISLEIRYFGSNKSST